MRSFTVLLAACVSLLSIHTAGAAVYDNFGPGDTYSTSGSNVSAFINIAAPFTPAADATAATVVVAMSNATTADANVHLSLVNDNGGRPTGSVIATGDLSVPVGDAQVFHVTLSVAAPLSAGTVYWIKAAPLSGSPGGQATWMLNSTGALGAASTLPTGLWIPNANSTTPTLRVEEASTAVGACCSGATCSVVSSTACTGADTRYAGDSSACNDLGNASTPCCKADFNQSGSVTVQDIFDFLASWFADDGAADINGGGLSVQDIFDFLSAWFSGC